MEIQTIDYGEHQLYFEPDEHKYWLDQDELISVTHYLKLAGYCRPYNGDGSAAMRGRFVHEATRLLDHGRLDWARLDPKLVGYVRCWERFKLEWDFVPDLFWRERPCFHPYYRWAGTPDAPGMMKDVPCVAEIKTGAPEPWHKLQVKGGYTPLVGAHDARFAKGAVSLLVYLNDEDKPANVVRVTDLRLDMLFASIVATVNGKAIYGNNNGT